MFGDFNWLLIYFKPLTKFMKIENQFHFQDICKEAYPIGIQKDLETYARMIFWLVGCMNPKWRGLYIGNYREINVTFFICYGLCKSKGYLK